MRIRAVGKGGLGEGRDRRERSGRVGILSKLPCFEKPSGCGPGE